MDKAVSVAIDINTAKNSHNKKKNTMSINDATLHSLRQTMADKLWQTLFGGGDSAMLAPWQIRSGGKNRLRVREAEAKAIANMQRELHELHAGRMRFNRDGKLVEIPPEELMPNIRLNPLIEQAPEDPMSLLCVPDTAEALRDVRLEADIQALSRSLNVRSICLRADVLIDSLDLEAVSPHAVDSDWLPRWKESAARASSEEFQMMWARVLVDEVRQPGGHSLRTLAFLDTLSRQEMTAIRLVSRLNIGGFVCREAHSYLSEEVHGPLFVQLRQMGLMQAQTDNATSATSITLPSMSKDNTFRTVLRSHSKALYIEGPGSELSIQAHLFTDLGKEVLALFPTIPDTGYLFAVAGVLKKRGYKLDIGDWVSQANGRGLFVEKMQV